MPVWLLIAIVVLLPFVGVAIIWMTSNSIVVNPLNDLTYSSVTHLHYQTL